MNLYRPNYLERGDEGLHDIPSEILSLELSDADIQRLVDPDQGQYTSDRFMSFEAPVAGWSYEDKVHVWLKEPQEADRPKLAELSLDQGGDLYFSIFNGHILRTANECEEFDDLQEFVTSDPGQTLTRLGITTVRLYTLPELTSSLTE